VLDQKGPNGHRFLEWRYKPGQRLELSIPVEQWTGRIVLPVDAVVEEGAEMYVYRQNGKLFERVPVHVEYRDRQSVVIANDGTLFPGDVVAGTGAYQIHLALKNKSGGGIDPHAGHNH
ncbi:MAG: secretion protein HlyD, partial [Pirellulales bacterium]